MNVFDRLNQIARLLETRSGPADADADADASVRPMLSSRSAPVRYAARTVLGLHDTEMDVLPKPQLERQDDEPAALTVTLKRPRSSSSREHARDEERRKRRAAYADAFLKKDAVDTTGPTNDSNDDELSVLNDELLHYAQETCATSLARVVTLLGTMAPRQVARVCGAEGVLHCAKWPDQVLLALWASGAASVWPARPSGPSWRPVSCPDCSPSMHRRRARSSRPSSSSQRHSRVPLPRRSWRHWPCYHPSPVSRARHWPGSSRRAFSTRRLPWMPSGSHSWTQWWLRLLLRRGRRPIWPFSRRSSRVHRGTVHFLFVCCFNAALSV